MSSLLRQAVAQPMFAEVGPMRHVPAASRVLMRREGYRDLLILWHVFQHARRPLFARLRDAIDVRDVATLYELWAFFALIEEIAVALDESPLVAPLGDDVGGLGWDTTAHFGAKGQLVYNQTRQSYSRIAMRPDVTWIPANGSPVALDAKFRLTRAEVQPEATALAETQVKHDDLYRMHAYRDALTVRAAIVVYPGDVAVFHAGGKGEHAPSLREVLVGDWSGVGAIPMRPGQGSEAAR